MLEIVLHQRATGRLPVAFGRGMQDYIFVENCAHAHVDCMEAALQRPQQGRQTRRKEKPGRWCPPRQLQRCVFSFPVAGQAFFLSDFHSPIWQHCQPFLAAANLTVPALFLPSWLVFALAYLSEGICYLAYALARVSWAPTLNLYTATVLNQDFTLSPANGKGAEYAAAWVQGHSLRAGGVHSRACVLDDATRIAP